MRRVWAGLLIGGAASAAAAALWLMLAQPLMTEPSAPEPVMATSLVRNRTIFAGETAANGSETVLAAARAASPTAVRPADPPRAPASTPASTHTPARTATAPPATRPASAPAAAALQPRPALTAPAAHPAPAAPVLAAATPSRSPSLDGGPAGHSHCAAPAAPSAPSAAAAPTEAQLASFASAVERFDSDSSRYRLCLDMVFNDMSHSEDVRRAALTAANANALQAGALWDAYDAATQRYRAFQAEAAREGTEAAASRAATAPDTP